MFRIWTFFLFFLFLGIRFYRWIKKSINHYSIYTWQIVIGSACVLFLIFGVYQWMAWRHFLKTPLINSGSTTVIVYPNSTVKQLSEQLKARRLLSHPKFFLLLAHQLGAGKQLKVGEYSLNVNMTPGVLIQNIMAGKVVMRKLTIVEGTTMRQLRQLLASNSSLQPVATKQTDEEIMASLGLPGYVCEGNFFPDTYVYTWGNKDTVILQQAFQKMNMLLQQEWPRRAQNLPYKTPNEALIVASLIESETELANERPIIASVILRRLQKNMRLQIDPTVLYGVGKPFGSVITLEDLHNDNPYNTYVHVGLPPTPINMPSAASIYAALHPADGNFLFYVAQGDGGHHFSTTYPEHLQAVQHYRDYKKYQADKQIWYGIGLFIVRSTGLY